MSTRIPDETGEQTLTAPSGPQAAPLTVISKRLLHGLEHLAAYDRIVLPLMAVSAMHNVAEIQPVLEQVIEGAAAEWSASLFLPLNVKPTASRRCPHDEIPLPVRRPT